MEKTEIEKAGINLILDLYYEEKMTIEEIERVTPFDFAELTSMINDKITI